MATPEIGKNTDSWCTRCKLVLAHTIEAMVNGKIVRVHCNTCGGQHAFRRNAPGTAKAARTPRTGGALKKPEQTERPAPNYEQLLRGRDPNTARPYAMSERFRQKELIRHASFGLGLVTTVKESDKIEVVFSDRVRILTQGRAT